MRSFLCCSIVAIAGTCCICPDLHAAIVVVSNSSPSTIAFDLKGTDSQDGTRQLLPGETRPFSCSSTVQLDYTDNGKTTSLKLEPYSAYVFVSKRDKLELVGIELAGRAVPAAPRPGATAKAPLRVSIKLLVDDSERRTRRTWEPALRQRVEQAAAVLKAHTGVQFEVVAVEDWEVTPTALDMPALLADFEKQVKVEPATLAIGYTSRPLEAKGEEAIPFALSRSAFHSHILLREYHPRTESERLEVLVQQLGKYLGAIPSPDPSSVMRVKLGDGKAVNARFRIGFDALNTLAMSIWAEQMSLTEGKRLRVNELSEDAKVRLGRVYGTLSLAMPDEPLPAEFTALLPRAAIEVVERAGEPAPAAGNADAVTPRADGKPMRSVLSPKEESIRRVVRAVTLRAESNARKPALGPDARLRGDALTEVLVRTAADVASTEEKGIRTSAFLIGLGIAMDDSMVLRGNPIAHSLCLNVESDDERNRRIAVLGTPTMRFRRDLCQHFVISAALTELAGPAIAEQAGLAKELIDMNRASGFSFVDLTADFAGIEFAKSIQANKLDIDTIARIFKVINYLPSLENLPDGLPAATFQSKFGSISDPRFQKTYDEVRTRVKALDAYRD